MPPHAKKRVSGITKLETWFQTYVVPCDNMDLHFGDIHTKFQKFIHKSLAAETLIKQFRDLGIYFEYDHRDIKYFRLKNHRFVLTAKDGKSIIRAEDVRNWWTECERKDSGVNDDVAKQFNRRFDANILRYLLADELKAFGIDCYSDDNPEYMKDYPRLMSRLFEPGLLIK